MLMNRDIRIINPSN